MRVEIKTPFAELALEMAEWSARKLVNDSLEYSEKFNGMDKAVNMAKEPAPVAGEDPAVRMEAPKREKSKEHLAGGYKGFLHIVCSRCGEHRTFCAKVPVASHKCFCGCETELTNLKNVFAECKCGRNYKYKTNAEDDYLILNCIDCGAPMDVGLNERRNAYIPL